MSLSARFFHTQPITPQFSRVIGGYLYPVFRPLWWIFGAIFVEHLSLNTILHVIREELAVKKSYVRFVVLKSHSWSVIPTKQHITPSELIHLHRLSHIVCLKLLYQHFNTMKIILIFTRRLKNILNPVSNLDLSLQRLIFRCLTYPQILLLITLIKS